MGLLSAAAKTAGLGVAAGAGVAAYSAWEARQYTLRELTVATLPVGADPIRVLHLSDIHLVPSQRAKLRWLKSLVDLEPDLVVNTGDNLAHRDAVMPLVSALGRLLDRPGVFVLGSNDYFAPHMRNPLRYLLPDDGSRRTDGVRLPWRTMSHRFRDNGWLDLTNTKDSLVVNGTAISFVGVDDPHLKYDRLDAIGGPADETAGLRLGITHAPYLRVLDQFAADGYDGIIAGHTHGGQVCVPFTGQAIVTNCDLPRAYARGLHPWPPEDRLVEQDAEHPSVETSWLHVSAGLGTSPYTPFRLACRPEATLLHLVPREAATPDAAGSQGLQLVAHA